MTIVGLTGGIGVGKSTVARLLQDRGAHVIDVDIVCREVIEPGGSAHQAIIDRFGPHLVGADGRLDRAALGKVVFGDPTALADLTALSHPAANGVMAAEVARQAPGTVVVLDMAVLVEYPALGPWPAQAQGGTGYDTVVVVEAPLQTRLKRLMEQRGMDPEDARSRIAAQASSEQRRLIADHIVDNGGDLQALRPEVDALWKKLNR